MKFQKLYKSSAKNKIQEWEIYTVGNIIITTHGQQNGKKQVTEELIRSGKNIGRANETTPIEQAGLEARAKWTKKHDKDYHRHIDNCKEGTKLANVGGYLPMLAQSYKKHGEKHLKYECYVQPKLDGIRCISTKKDGIIKLWFRSGKEIITMGHIVKDLEKIMKDGDILDGELYIHEKEFNSFTGAIRANKNLNPEITEKIKYHIYDYPRIVGLTEKDAYKDRFREFYARRSELPDSIVWVDTYMAHSYNEAMLLYKELTKKGYEGIIFRNLDSPYEQKRSFNLLKFKEFFDDEFIIIGAEEGKGKLAGHVGSFICKIEPGRVLQDIGGTEVTFGNIEGRVKAKMKGKTEYLKYLFEHPEEYMGKPLTIRYQNLSKDLILRFPVGVGIRFDK